MFTLCEELTSTGVVKQLFYFYLFKENESQIDYTEFGSTLLGVKGRYYLSRQL